MSGFEDLFRRLDKTQNEEVRKVMIVAALQEARLAGIREGMKMGK